MLHVRVIPVLLLKDGGLVKTVKFSDDRYVGDPINAVRIFNEKEVDEIVFLDISAARENREPSFSVVEEIAAECFMPLAYGGGVRTLAHARQLFRIGVEKVIINGSALDDTRLITEIADVAGAQAVVGAIDVKKPLMGSHRVYDHRSGASLRLDPVDHARRLVAAGAGEIIVNSVDRDGTQEGYALDVIAAVADAVNVPVIALGGAGGLADMRKAVMGAGASAAAAGSLFVFHGKHRAVLITYPKPSQIADALQGPAS